MCIYGCKGIAKEIDGNRWIISDTRRFRARYPAMHPTNATGTREAAAMWMHDF